MQQERPKKDTKKVFLTADCRLFRAMDNPKVYSGVAEGQCLCILRDSWDLCLSQSSAVE